MRWTITMECRESPRRNDDAAIVRNPAVLPQIDRLPGPQPQLGIHDRDDQGILGQNSADMGRHIVRALRIVLIRGVAIRNHTRKDRLEILPDTGIGVLTQYE